MTVTSLRGGRRKLLVTILRETRSALQRAHHFRSRKIPAPVFNGDPAMRALGKSGKKESGKKESGNKESGKKESGEKASFRNRRIQETANPGIPEFRKSGSPESSKVKQSKVK